MEAIDDIVLGQMLVQRGLLKPEQLESAYSSVTPNRPLSKVLVDSKLVSADVISGLATAESYHTIASKPPVVESGIKTKVRPAPPPTENLPPEVREMAKNPEYCFQKFILIGMLGKGGMGEVWKAWQRDLRRFVAIKFLESRDGVDLERFNREAQTAASLTHQNITALYELNRHEDKYYIVMELVDGVTLQNQAGKIPFTKAAKVIREAALALDYAHKCGIIHRDIKPQNIMVARTGRVYVMDFGLAKQQREGGGNTMQGMILGTPAYMSPEQADGKLNRLDKRSDVYSLGATLYCLVTGKQPVPNSSVMSMLYKVVHGEFPAPREVNPRVPAEVEAIILKAMDLLPAHRYASAASFAEDLRKYIDGEPISAAPPSFFRKLRHNLKKNAIPAAIAGVVLLVGIVGLVVFSAARSGTTDIGEVEKREAALKKKEEELRKATSEKQVGDRIEKIRQAWQEAERAFIIEAQDWDPLAKKADAVIAAATAFLKENPRNAEALHLKGRAHFLKLDYEAAETALKASIDSDGAYAPAPAELGRLYLIWGEETDFAKDPSGRRFTETGDHVRRRMGLYLSNLLKFVQDKAERAMAESALSYIGRDFVKAEEAARKAVEAGPDRWEPHFQLAKSLRQLRRKVESQSSAEAALRLQRNNPHILKLLADVQAENKQDENALRNYAALIRLRPTVYAYYQRSALRFRQKKYAEALKDAELAIKAAPKNPAGYVMKGQCLLEDKKIGESIAPLDEAIRIDAKCGEAYSVRAFAKMANHDAEGALKDFDLAIDVDPEEGSAWAGRSELNAGMRNLDAAFSDMARAAAIDPDSFAAHYMIMLVQSGKIEEAVESGKRFAKLCPNDGQVHWQLAEAQFRKGEWLEAYDNITIADRLIPNASRLLFCRGSILYRLSRWQDSLNDFEQVLRINNDDGAAYCIRGSLYGKLGRYQDGVESMLTGFKWFPHLKPVYEQELKELQAKAQGTRKP